MRILREVCSCGASTEVDSDRLSTQSHLQNFRAGHRHEPPPRARSIFAAARTGRARIAGERGRRPRP